MELETSLDLNGNLKVFANKLARRHLGGTELVLEPILYFISHALLLLLVPPPLPTPCSWLLKTPCCQQEAALQEGATPTVCCGGWRGSTNLDSNKQLHNKYKEHTQTDRHTHTTPRTAGCCNPTSHLPPLPLDALFPS
ncbi:unnamed protein product [Lepidochelys olivacea]